MAQEENTKVRVVKDRVVNPGTFEFITLFMVIPSTVFMLFADKIMPNLFYSLFGSHCFAGMCFF